MTVVRHQPQSPQRPKAYLWLIAAVELTLAIVVSRLMLGGGHEGHASHGAHLSHGDPMPLAHGPSWGLVESVALATVAAACVWLVLRRSPIAALALSAVTAVFIATPGVRAAAAGSHLIAMLVMEAAMTVIPLLLVLAAGERLLPTKSRWWAAATAIAFGASIVAIHLPQFHDHIMNGERGFPVWAIAIAVVVATAFWSTVLHSGLTTPFRRRVLIGGQEAAAFVGLLSLFASWPAHPGTAMTLWSPAWDQRLGGVVMLVTCFLVTRTALRRIDDESADAGIEEA